jgi:cob(I)alamin adenosyltransferase
MRITKVYTRTGDEGDTGLVGGVRVAKDHPRVEAYGTVDELSSAVGWARAELARATASDPVAAQLLDRHLEYIQHRLFDLGAILATPLDEQQQGMPEITADLVTYMELLIDGYNQHLPALRDFVLPGGNGAVASLHVARCVARRAERRVTSLHRMEPLAGEELAFLNRLSDLLFVLARWVAKLTSTPEFLWRRDLERPLPPPAAGRE